MQARIEINLPVLQENADRLLKYLGDFYCVLKCDAYGHGTRKCAEALYRGGHRYFAVFSLDEALEIKSAAPDSEVLILGRTELGLVEKVIANGFAQTVFSSEYANELAPYSKGLRIHVKIDSGMNRCGFKCAPSEIKTAFLNFKGNIEGAYTHFPRADEKNLTPTEASLEAFLEKSGELDALLGKKLIKHSAASACALRLPAARLDRSRIGLALYGYLPENCTLPFSLKSVMSLIAPVISVKTVKKGEGVSYGGAPLEKNSVIATVACGYANGLVCSAGQYLKPNINGFEAKIVGRVCMDRCMLDVTEIFENGRIVKVYDKVRFLDNATAFAAAESTIPYEILTRVGKMNKRNYIK